MPAMALCFLLSALLQPDSLRAQGIWPFKKHVVGMPRALEAPTGQEMDLRHKGDLPWIVFSDRPDNFTSTKPYSSVASTSLKWLEPLMVLQERHGFLRVAKYDPQLLRGRTIMDKKRVLEYGWIDKSRLLLSPLAFVNRQSGFPEKAITLVNGPLPLGDPKLFFDQSDSVIVYSSPFLTDPIAKVRLHELTYRYKVSADGKAVLIGSRQRVQPDSATRTIRGWLSSQLVQSWGDRRYLATKDFPLYPSRSKGLFNAVEGEAYDPFIRKKDIPLIAFPVAEQHADSITLKASAPLYERSYNTLVTINGTNLSYQRYLDIHKNLAKINVIWVVDGGSAMKKYFAALNNMIQSLETDFHAPKLSYPVQYGAVVYRDSANCVQKGLSSMPALTPDYRSLMAFLKSESVKTSACSNQVAPAPLYDAVREAIALCKDRPGESNLIVIVGSVGDYSTNLRQLPQEIAGHNARILTLQMYSEYNEWFNNFVLNAKKMVSESAVFAAEDRKGYVVDAEGLNPKQWYNTSQLDSISYYLDFPNNSLVQGGVVFPTKGEVISKKQLTTAIRRFIDETQQDITKQISSLDSAFRRSGIAHENIQNDFFARYGGADDAALGDAMPHNEFRYGLTVNRPLDTPQDSLQHLVLLSRLEYEDLMGLLESLAALEGDVYSARSRRGLVRLYEQGMQRLQPQVGVAAIHNLPLREYFTKVSGLAILPADLSYSVGDILQMPDDRLKAYQLLLRDALERFRVEALSHRITVMDQPYYFISENSFNKSSITK